MSSQSDFLNRLEDFENGKGHLEGQEESWYNSFTKGLTAIGELKLKEELEGYYQEHQQEKGGKVVQIWSIVAIAVMLVLGGFYLSTLNSSSDSIQLQMNEAPIYSDSAVYDSSQKKFEKKIEDDVDE